LSFENGLTLKRELFDSPDAKEGINAFNSKRTPSFKGV